MHSTASSSAVRVSLIERPLRGANPVISPSLGPGPKSAPMYMPVAAPQRTMPATISAARGGSARDDGIRSSAMSIDSPTSTTLLSVPSPGR